MMHSSALTHLHKQASFFGKGEAKHGSAPGSVRTERYAEGAHAAPHDAASEEKIIALVGHQNVGKSALFQRLTGIHATVSNYPGTTIDVMRGPSEILSGAEVIDTPGVVTLPSRSADEQATVQVLLNEALDAIIQVGDAKNVSRTLLLTVLLAEMEIPLVLALNMMDEAETRGIKLNSQLITHQTHTPVVPTVAVQGKGIGELTAAVMDAPAPHLHLQYPDPIETVIAEITVHLPSTPISARSLALLWLCEDPAANRFLKEKLSADTFQHLVEHRHRLQFSFAEPLSIVIQRVRLSFVDKLAADVILDSGGRWSGLGATIGHLTTHPFWGFPILLGVLYAMYWFVGIIGAGVLVDLLETRLFGEIINPWVSSMVMNVIPMPLIAEFLIGEYGLWTLGMTYALALVLPIVGTFFIAFSLLEDSGYLPRLAAFTNRLFRFMGLNGKAVLPMVLGLGCVTMATMTTRILENKRDRLMVILLLALAVPCSAQLGIVMGMLASISLSATIIWAAVVLGVLLLVGWLAARVLPGERSTLLVELPPMRWPSLANVLTKTLVRLEWYLKEVVPLFLLGAVIIFAMDKTGALAWLIQKSEPLISGWLGLPGEASAAFILGFLRRDFGATGFFVMQSQGHLNAQQVVVSMITITLFIPCIASVFMIAKERGWLVSLSILAIVMPLAFVIGGLANLALGSIGWGI